MRCRHCASDLDRVFLDLAFSPPSNAYITEQGMHKAEVYFPLKLFVCEECWLVQTKDYSAANELFQDDYAYFSSTSSSWLEHCHRYTQDISARLKLNQESFVIEVASNDGYLLKNFVDYKIPCLGIEPTDSTATAAEKIGVPVERVFFGVDTANRLAEESKQADLIIGNNVYAHVPDINDFTAGLKRALKASGTITLEFPHLYEMLTHHQFDTVYHEHYSYLSLSTVSRIFSAHGLKIYDVEQLPTHGGSLRIYGSHSELNYEISSRVKDVLELEKAYGMQTIEAYDDFQRHADNIKNDLLGFLLECKRMGKRVAAYGAAAKGNTLLNYAGIKYDIIPEVYDAAPSKQGKYMPGSHIPILHPDKIQDYRPDTILVLPWNIATEVVEVINQRVDWNIDYYIAIPELKKIA